MYASSITIDITEISLNDLAKASETSFAKDWLRPEEEDAWNAYQSDK